MATSENTNDIITEKPKEEQDEVESECAQPTFNEENIRHDEPFDSNKLLERSQSDADLLVSPREHVLMGHAMSLEQIPGQDRQDKTDGQRISEMSRVYLDLSRLEPGDADKPLKEVRLKLKLGKSLQTIPQDQVLRIEDSSTLSHQSSFDTEDVCSPDSDDNESFYSKCPLIVHQSDRANRFRGNLKLNYETFSREMDKEIRSLHDKYDTVNQIVCLSNIKDIISNAWGIPAYGRDLAYSLCDVIRAEGVLDMLCDNCQSKERRVLQVSIDLLEKVMSTRNRREVAKYKLEPVVKMARSMKEDKEISESSTGIMEHLFKTSEDTCSKVITYGGLDVILYWCRSDNTKTLRHCAKALANLALYGGCDNQEVMTKQKVPEWLFPLAFLDDDSVRYYAFLALASLMTNKEIEAAVLKSGACDLIMPFISYTKPSTFAKSDFEHLQGYSEGWLRRLVPLLSSKREQAQAIAAFHFAMEAGIKAEQGKQQMFYEIGAIEPLKRVASSPNCNASKLAAEALRSIGESVPHKLSQQVSLWSIEDVSYWVSEIGFIDNVEKFKECQVDGDMLLLLNEEDLKDSIGIHCSITRKRFMRELKNLKIMADYSCVDPTGIDSWLMRLCPDLSQYTYLMLKQGLNKPLLFTASDEELRDDCGIKNRVHRRLILQHIEDMRLSRLSTIGNPPENMITDGPSLPMISGYKSLDVFISYRRSNGSQLASLLKVHLELRGFSVFLDIDRLRAGKFDDNLLMSIHTARHFLLVLTANALERCIGDDDVNDWVHKEIKAALDAKCNIIPIMDDFTWPPHENLPEDMRNIHFFNGIKWVHDYQDACVDKLESFLKGEVVTSPEKRKSLGNLQSVSSPDVCESKHCK